MLTEHQRQALAAYEALVTSHPQLFSGRQARPIVRDLKAVAEYAGEHGVVLGVVADTPYLLFIVDLVESRRPDGRTLRHPYLRVVSRAQLSGAVNVVVLATIANSALGTPGGIVLVEQERHAIGTWQLELPRGFGEKNSAGAVSALRELEEETGYVGDEAQLLGTVYPDSGLTDHLVSFYHVAVVRQVRVSREPSEAIRGVVTASHAQVWEKIRSGEIRDGFTLQAIALYERFVAGR